MIDMVSTSDFLRAAGENRYHAAALLREICGEPVVGEVKGMPANKNCFYWPRDKIEAWAQKTQTALDWSALDFDDAHVKHCAICEITIWADTAPPGYLYLPAINHDYDGLCTHCAEDGAK